MPTANYGALVPKAITVIAMTKEETPKLRAIFVEESIKTFALFTIIPRPIIKNINCIKSSFLGY